MSVLCKRASLDSGLASGPRPRFASVPMLAKVSVTLPRLLVGLMLAAPIASLSAQSPLNTVYTPPGYGSGQNLEGLGYGLSTGFTEVNDDYYLKLAPFFELPIGRFAVGLQVPLEVLVLDREPKTGEDVPSIRAGTFDDTEDYLKMVQYVRYGTHLYYDPDDTFNWSFFYGKMYDGYLGHKTVVYRYINNYDPTIYRAGAMADINNTWGGIEYFNSDVWRNEVTGWRGYIRPVGVFIGVRNLLFAGLDRSPERALVAMSNRELRDPRLNGGVFYQEKIPEQRRGGRLEQQFYKPIGESLPGEPGGAGNPSTGGSDGPGGNRPRFVEVTDPVTGETSVRELAPGEAPPPGAVVTGGEETDDDGSREAWDPSFWSRIAIGYFVVRDRDAPLTLEKDGSDNLVIDPETLRPRVGNGENLTFVGYDAEFRMSPFRWLDLTPYADTIKIEDLDGSEAIHGGLDMTFKFAGIHLTFRPEYREYSSNYIPVYFDQYHVIERTVFIPGGERSTASTSVASSQTKLAYLKSLPSDDPRVKGYFVELRFDWLQTFVVEANYEDYPGDLNSRIFVGVYLPTTAGFYFNGYYTKKAYDDIYTSFEFDDRSLAAAQLGYDILGGFAIQIGFQRTWVYDETTTSYVAQDETTYGFGYTSSL